MWERFAKTRRKQLCVFAALIARVCCIQHAKHPDVCQRAVCIFCNSTGEDGWVKAAYVQGPTRFKRMYRHTCTCSLLIFAKTSLFPFFFFSYICCVINRREEQASVGPLPMPILHLLSCFFFLLYSHCKRLFIEFTTEIF